jgi:hypothetical protein
VDSLIRMSPTGPIESVQRNRPNWISQVRLGPTHLSHFPQSSFLTLTHRTHSSPATSMPWRRRRSPPAAPGQLRRRRDGQKLFLLMLYIPTYSIGFSRSLSLAHGPDDAADSASGLADAGRLWRRCCLASLCQDLHHSNPTSASSLCPRSRAPPQTLVVTQSRRCRRCCIPRLSLMMQ